MQKRQSHQEAPSGSFQLGSWEEKAFTKGQQPFPVVLAWGCSQERVALAASMQAPGCSMQRLELQGEEPEWGQRGRLGATEYQDKTDLFL